MHTHLGTIEVITPFDLKRSAIFLEKFRPMKGEQEIQDDTITKAIMITGQTIIFRIKETGAGEKPKIGYELFSNEPLTMQVAQSAAERISFFLSLQEDIKPFYEIARKEDPKFYPIIKQFNGFHHVKFPSALEAAVWAILAQRGPMQLAKKMKTAFVERFGWSLELDKKKYWAFPDYSRVKNTGAKELHSIIGNQKKAEYLSGLLRGYDKINEKFLLNAEFDQAKKALMEIKGIGEWSATFILSRGLGRMEKLPQNLKTITPEITKIYGAKQSIERISTIYGKWVGYWLLYVWASRMGNKKQQPESTQTPTN
jgi:DNA-3-methyladenine glycosylase II